MSGERAPKRRRLSAAARRTQIIESARVVWCRSGAQRTTVREIASEAGITEHFVYQHFASREEIFRLAVLAPRDEALRRLLARLRDVAPGSGDAQRHIHAAFLAELPALIPLLSAAQFADPVDGPRFYGSVLLPALRDSLLAPMAALTGLAARSPWMDFAIRALVGAHFGVALESVLEEENVDSACVTASLEWVTGRGFAHAGRGRPARSAKASLPKTGMAPARPDDAPVLARKQLPRAERVAVILDAAREVFLAHGLRGARSRELAQRAGITEAFLLRIFRSKKQLYEAAVLQPLATALAGLAAETSALRGATQPAEIPGAYLRLALPFFVENGPLFVGALFAELDEARRYFHTALVPHLREVEATLAPALPAGIDPRTVRRALSGACWAVSFGAGEAHNERMAALLAALLGACPLEFAGDKARDPERGGEIS